MQKIVMNGIVLVSLMTGLHAQAVTMTRESVIHDVTLAYQMAFDSKEIRTQTIFRGFDPKTVVPWAQVEGLINDFVDTFAKGDKDLTGPWSDLKRDNKIITAAAVEWSRLIKAGNKDTAVMKQTIATVKDAIVKVDAVKAKIGKTIFLRSAKKDVAAVLKQFADLLARTGDKVVTALEIESSKKQ